MTKFSELKRAPLDILWHLCWFYSGSWKIISVLWGNKYLVAVFHNFTLELSSVSVCPVLQYSNRLCINNTYDMMVMCVVLWCMCHVMWLNQLPVYHHHYTPTYPTLARDIWQTMSTSLCAMSEWCLRMPEMMRCCRTLLIIITQKLLSFISQQHLSILNTADNVHIHKLWLIIPLQYRQ